MRHEIDHLQPKRSALGQSASQPAPSSVEVSVSSPATQPTETSGTTGTTATSGTSGTVLEVMDSGGYTYVRIQTKEAAVWAAGPQTVVKVGQSVQLAGEMPMQGFHSKTLNRTFDSILFAASILTSSGNSSPVGLPPQHPPITGAGKAQHPISQAAIKPGDIPKADGGFTIAELYGKKKELAGKHVLVRAKVVKSSANIMGKNWIHIQDGTGEAETCDLTVTTKNTARVGDIALVSGTLTTDKNIGSGYFFTLIIEDADVKVDTQP